MKTAARPERRWGECTPRETRDTALFVIPEVSVLLGYSDGGFGPVRNYATGNGSVSVLVADFNGDGLDDLAVTNGADNTVSVLLGRGDGTFRPQVAYSEGGQGASFAAVGDFNQDGIPDVVIANAWSNSVSVMLGVGCRQ